MAKTSYKLESYQQKLFVFFCFLLFLFYCSWQIDERLNRQFLRGVVVAKVANHICSVRQNYNKLYEEALCWTMFRVSAVRVLFLFLISYFLFLFKLRAIYDTLSTWCRQWGQSHPKLNVNIHVKQRPLVIPIDSNRLGI